MADMTQLDRVALMPLWALVNFKGENTCMIGQLLGIIELFKLLRRVVRQ